MTHSCLAFAAGDPVAAELGLGAAALRYMAMGYSVLPLARAAKKPHQMLGPSGGVHWATRDQDTVPGVWARDPAAGIGIACGQESQLVVIDLDVKSGHDGIAELTRWWLGDDWGSRAFVLSQAFPGAPVAVTPSDGRHIYLRTPPGMAVPQRLGILPGVDIKGDGGYVVAPPTMITVHTLDRPGEPGDAVLLPYRWAAGCPCSVTEAPGWLMEWIASAPPTLAETGGSAGPAVDLEGLRETGLEKGSRNAGLYRLACSLYGRYGTGPAGQAVAWAWIEAVLARTDLTGFGRSEIGTILASARQFVERAREREREQGEAARQWLTR